LTLEPLPLALPLTMNVQLPPEAIASKFPEPPLEAGALGTSFGAGGSRGGGSFGGTRVFVGRDGG
jgi:hypothetical protein